MSTTSEGFVKLLEFRHFERFFRFDQSDRKTYKKAISDGVNAPTLERVLAQMGFTRTADNMGAYKYNDVIHAYIEVMSYDKVRNDSEKRNKVLFDKLGISSGS